MSSIQTCRDTSDAVEMCAPLGLYLKAIARLNVSIQLPQMKTPGRSISSWEVMEKLRQAIKPDEFTTLKISKTTLEFIRFEGEVENRSALKAVVARLDNSTFKLSGFPDNLRVRAAEAKVPFPTRHDWDSYFRDAKGMDEMKPGERPDTIYVQGLPCKWFADKRRDADRPNEQLVCQAFGGPGLVRRLDIPLLDPYQKDAEASVGRISTFSFSQELTFDVYVQYMEYMGFVKAMDSLRGMKLMLKTPEGRAFTANIKVDFDRSRHLSEESIQRRQQERLKIEALEREREERVLRERLEEEQMREAERYQEELRKKWEEEEARRKREEEMRKKEEEESLRRKKVEAECKRHKGSNRKRSGERKKSKRKRRKKEENSSPGLEESRRRSDEQRLPEQKRLAERQRIVEDQRLAEKQRLAEQQHITEQQRLAEQKRHTEQQRIIEQQRLAEQRCLAEQQRIVEQQRLVELQQIAEQERITEQERIAQQQLISEQERIAERECIAEEPCITDQERITEQECIAEQHRQQVESEERQQECAAEATRKLQATHLLQELFDLVRTQKRKEEEEKNAEAEEEENKLREHLLRQEQLLREKLLRNLEAKKRQKALEAKVQSGKNSTVLIRASQS
ncbi:uncharacterized protein LOC142579014 isoform X2 [Dermacentor variabilis]|uniref:uncharacterized protein LOC142579014 isoform X2 n=1 Tax=Dermacentor variabilis TaxID=34621 RepID=UPI003F5B4AF9